jgi:pimeloyl-ACP methyl ester carboxylesterase
MDFDYVVLPAIIFLVGILIVALSVRRILSLSTKSYRTWRKIVERTVLAAVVLLVAALAGSSAFNAIALHRFWATNPPPGAFYSVNGHRMHMNCTSSGSPTIVLESGLGNDALIWGGVQPELSKTTRVCSYDRAGFGWSDPLPAPHDADHIAVELHELLSQAKVTGPIVLMGHSIAGVYMRDYASRYPADIAGLVFIDVATPLEDEGPIAKALGAKEPPIWIEMLLMRAPLIAGLPRLYGACSQKMPGFEAHASQLEAEDICNLHMGAFFAELDSFNHSGHETVHTGPYGALPILIFSKDATADDPTPMWLHRSAQQKADLVKISNQMQENLKRLSTRSRRIIAKGTGHYVMIDRPELIEREVRPFIEQIRGAAPQPDNYGSTSTE